VLSSIVAKEGLETEVKEAMEKAVRVKEPTPGWKNICQWNRLKRNEKIYIRNIFIARDKIARSFNVPAARVMDKHRIISLAMDPPESRAELRKRLSSEPQRFRSLLEEKVAAALETSEKEIKEGS
ncbi:MAG: hypothetical protein ACI4S4_08115, partial [Candidatus Ornithospirochaeta sp.]